MGEETEASRTEFLRLGTVDVWRWTILGCGGRPVCCGMQRSVIVGPYPTEVPSPQLVTSKTISSIASSPVGQNPRW